MCDRDTVTELQCYQILRVNKNSSFEDIRHAYIDLAWQCQKQLIAGNEANRKQAEENFKSINQAYEQLKSRFQTFNFPAAEKNKQNKQDVGVRKTNPEFWYQKGVLQDQLGEKEEAIRSFSQAIRLDSQYLEARFYRAHLLSQRGFECRAQADYRVIDESISKTKSIKVSCLGKDRVYVRPGMKEIVRGEIRVIILKLHRFRQRVVKSSSMKYSVLALTGFVFVIWLSR